MSPRVDRGHGNVERAGGLPGGQVDEHSLRANLSLHDSIFSRNRDAEDAIVRRREIYRCLIWKTVITGETDKIAQTGEVAIIG